MNPESASSTALRGGWLILARAAWVAVAALTVGLFVAGIPAEFAQLQLGCPTPACASSGQIAPVELRLLEDLGLSPDFFAAYGVALDLVFAVVYTAVAVVIFWRKSADRLALFVALALLAFGTATYPSTMTALTTAYPVWRLPVAALHFVGSASFILFLYLFPDGRFVPRWTRWVALVWIAWLLPRYWFPDWPPSGSDTWLAWPNSVVWSGALGAVVYAQVHRYRRVSNRVQRQQTKWAVFGIAMALTGFLSVNVAVSAVGLPAPASAGVLATLMVGAALMYGALLLIPLSIGIAILRSQLFDIDLLINRTLVYGTLTVSIIGLYVLGVGALGRLLQTQSNLAVSILALLMVAALVQPLRRGLQRGLNRLTRVEPSQRDDPSAALKLPETELSRSREKASHTPMRAESASNTLLHGRWLVIARAVWIAIAVVTLALFVASIPLVFNELRTVSFGEGTSIWQLRPDEARALEQLGLSVDFYAVYWIVIQVVFVLGFALVAGVIFWRKSDDWLALFVSIFLVMSGANTVTAVPVPTTIFTAWYLAYKIIQDLIFISTPLFFFLFPDGQLVPRWTRPLAAGWIVFGLIKRWLPFSAPPGDLILLGCLGLGALAQIYRYRRISNTIQRQQTKWVVFGFGLTFVVFTGVQLLFVIFPWLRQPGAMLYRLPALTVILLSLLVLPLTIGIAILRYRLWDIDVLINRTLVYGALSASVVGLYILVVGFLGALLRTGGNLAISVLATGLVALLFQPLRTRLQRGVNRLMYGERDDPYAVLSRLGQRLEATLAPEAVLPTIVQTVKDALKLPYTAIALKQDDAFVVAAASGIPVEDALRLWLVYQNETVGQLLLAPRAPGEAFSAADLRLLDDLARQAGVAAHAVRLTTDLQRLTVDLQRSRERLVTTREEERRRLRRDLHDGLGPTLASLAQRLDTARILVPRDPDAAVALLGDLKAQFKTTIADIRQLVYALRPPALDELGLVSAIREHATHYNESNGLRVSLEAPERLPPLPAAVEVAAYRIVLEALTNIVRHAHARACCIRLQLTDSQTLYLEITDDGRGLPADYHAGVGLTSMRERAMELGGECRIEPGPTHGIRVVARLPLPRE